MTAAVRIPTFRTGLGTRADPNQDKAEVGALAIVLTSGTRRGIGGTRFSSRRRTADGAAATVQRWATSPKLTSPRRVRCGTAKGGASSTVRRGTVP